MVTDLAYDRMAAARVSLLFTSPQAGQQLTRLKLVASNVPDIEIVGSRLFYNPEWVRQHPTICGVCPAVTQKVAEVGEKYFETVVEVRRMVREEQKAEQA